MIQHSPEFFTQDLPQSEPKKGPVLETKPATPESISERHSLDINVLLSYKNPREKEYAELAKDESTQIKESLKSGTNPGHRVAGIWYGLFPLAMDQQNEELFEQMEKIRQAMKDKPFIDLGGGEFSAMETFAKEHGVTSYVNVDNFHPLNELMQNSTEVVDDTGEGAKESNGPDSKSEGVVFVEQNPDYDYEKIIVPQDMLSFLSKMQPTECNFALNGIDGFVINSNKYHKALAEELARVSLPGNLVFATNSVAVEYLEKNGFARATDVTIGKFTEHSGIFRRV